MSVPGAIRHPKPAFDRSHILRQSMILYNNKLRQVNKF